MDRLSAIEAFVAVAETRSFTRAAGRMRLLTPMVTLHIARLEEHLGTRLFDRTTRRGDLTDEGIAFLQHAREILASYAAAENAVLPGRGLRGRVRIDAPASIGHRAILPHLAEIHSAFPDIAIDLSLGDRGTLYRIDGFDIILRVGEASLSGWVRHDLGVTRLLCIAARDYLEHRPSPNDPEDLDRHSCILYASVDTASGGNPWFFTRDGKAFNGRPSPAYTFNDGRAMLSAVRAGLGIAQHLEMIACDDLRSGCLLPVLLPWAARPVKVTLMSKKQRYALPHVRAVMDYLETRVEWGLG